MSDKALKEAIASAGGGKALARALGVSPQAVYQWSRVPVDRVLEVERFTGIPRGRLRPDIYGPELTPRSEYAGEDRRQGPQSRRARDGYDRRDLHNRRGGSDRRRVDGYDRRHLHGRRDTDSVK